MIGLVVVVIVAATTVALTRSSGPSYKPVSVSQLLRAPQLGSWSTGQPAKASYAPKDDYFSAAFPAAHNVRGGCDVVAGDLPTAPSAQTHAEVELTASPAGTVSVVEELASFPANQSTSVYRASVASLAACHAFSYQLNGGVQVAGTNGPLTPPDLADQSALYEFKYTATDDRYHAYFMVARKGSEVLLVYYTPGAHSLAAQTINAAAVADLNQPPSSP